LSLDSKLHDRHRPSINCQDFKHTRIVQYVEPADEVSVRHVPIIPCLTCCSVWQTAARNRNSQSTSRTPQSRSGNASPAQQGNLTQPPRQDTAVPTRPTNVWAQRGSQSGERQQQAAPSNGPVSAAPQSEEPYAPANGFNGGEVKTFLGREAQGAPASYKVQDGRSGGGAWGNKGAYMYGRR